MEIFVVESRYLQKVAKRIKIINFEQNNFNKLLNLQISGIKFNYICQSLVIFSIALLAYSWKQN